MKYYSETLKRLFDTEKALIAAEEEERKLQLAKQKSEELKKAQRATRAKEVQTALKEANEAQSKAIKLLKDFTKDYGYFHTSYTIDDEKTEPLDFFDILNGFLSK